MNGKKKLISKITALLLALLLTNHFVFQAYASGEMEIVVTESAAEAVAAESEAPLAEAALAGEAAVPEEAEAGIPAAVDEAISGETEVPEEAAEEPAAEEAAAEEAEAAEEAAAEEAAAEEPVAEEAAAEEAEAAEAEAEEPEAAEAAAPEAEAVEAEAEEEVEAAPEAEAVGEAEEEIIQEAAEPAAVGDAASAWAEISPAFTVENIMAAGIKDANFAQAIHKSISDAAAAGTYEATSFSWASDLPMPLTLEEIAEESYSSDIALTQAILENYAGRIRASDKGITSIAGWQLLRSASVVDVTENEIEDISDFLQEDAPVWSNGIKGIHPGWHFEYNPIWKYPAAGDSYPTIHNGQAVYNFSPTLIANGKLSYLFGESVDPTLNLGVMMGEGYVDDWMFNFWTTATAVGSGTPETFPALTPGQRFNFSSVQMFGITEAGTMAFNVTTRAVISNEGYQGTDPYTHTYSLIPTLTLERYGLLYVNLETETLGGFHFKKVSANDSSVPVAGATYTLYRDEACTDEVGSYVTDENGEFYVNGLAPQTYYLKEVATPEGYELSDEVKTITISEVQTSTSVEGGVPSIMLDARTNPDNLKEYGDIELTNDWVTTKTYSGIMLKSIEETKDVNAQMIDPEARAIITNKGTTGYKKIDSISATAAGENYDTDIEVVVKTGLSKENAAEIGTYDSLADATAAINAYTDGKSLNGNIYVDINTKYTQKVDAYDEVNGNDKPEPVKVKIPVEKTVKGGDGEYTFQLCDEEGGERDSVTFTTVNGVGTAEFDELVFEGPNPFNSENGTYTYLVREVLGDDPSVTYDENVYTYEIAVKEGPHTNEAGETVQGLYVEVTKNGVPAEDLTAAFTNIKMLPVAVQLKAEKILENAKLLDGEFTFVLEGSVDNETVQYEATCDADGVITFNPLTFTVPGTYTYTLKEKDPDNPRITADDTTHNIAIVVELVPNSQDGASTATVYVDGTKVGTATSDGTLDPAPVVIDTGVEFTNIADLPFIIFVAEKIKDDDEPVNAGEFTFALTVDDYTGLTYEHNGETKELTADLISKIPTDANGKVNFSSVFDCIRFPAAEKTYTFTLTENDIEGDSWYQKDTAVFTIKVPVVLNEETGFYDIGELEALKDGEPTETIRFRNIHKRAPLTVTKSVAAGGDTTKKFEFTVMFSEPVDELVIAEGATPIKEGLNTIGFKFSLADGESMVISNIPVGTGYTVTEAAEDDSSYFPTEAVSGTIEEEGENVTNTAEFNNVIKRGPISITKEISNTKDYMDAENDEFEFKITVTPGTGATIDGFNYVIDDGEPVEVSGLTTTVSIKAGQIIQILDLPYGTTVKAEELNAEELHYTAAESELEGVINGTENTLKLNFVNVKDTPEPISVQPEVMKTVDGEVPATVVMLVNGVRTEVPFAEAFTFAIARSFAPDGVEQLNNAAQTAKNDADGKVTFGEITGIDRPGIYKFEIWELNAADEDSYMLFDGTHYIYEVEVGYNKDENKLVVEKESYLTADGTSYDEAVFNNKTIGPQPVPIGLDAVKTVNGASPVMMGTYRFTLENTSAPEGAEAFESRTAFDAAGGRVDFGDITYEVPGTYEYEIREIAGDAENVIYDARVWKVTVVVEDDGTSTNTLDAEVSYEVTGENPSVEEETGEVIHFANYTKVPVEIPVEKRIEGNPIYGIPTFNFTIAAHEETPEAPLPEITTLSVTADDFENNTAATVFGSIAYGEAGTYCYTINETAESKDGWTYDTTPVNVAVTVAFDGGKLVASVEYMKGSEPAEKPEFVNNFTPVPVKFSKQDLGGEELPGATIQILDKDGNLVDEWVSSDTPHEITGILPGDYVMHEVAAPDGYTVTTDIPFTVDENGLVDGGREVDMTDAPTKVVISKQDLGGEELPGATITIYDSEGNVATTVFGETCEWVSGDTPKTIEGLPVGSYTLHEVVAPDGYTVTTDISFTISEDGTVTVTDEEGNPVDVEELVLTDAPITVNFSKTDAGGEELPGAVITVYDAEGNIAKTVKGEELTWTSTDVPKVIEGLPAGEYVMHEDTAPAGYTLSNDIRFVVEADTGKVTIIEINGEEVNLEAEDSTVVMVDELTEISISKQDLGGEELPGATIVIYDKEGNVAKTYDGTECAWESSDTPHEIKGLPAGSYVLHEVVAPEGYTVTTDINFTVNEDGTVTVTDENGNPVDVDQLVLTDAPNEVIFSKQDLGGDELPGAEIVVYDQNGNIAKTIFGEELSWTSTDTPKVVNGLPAGTYVMHEVVAPDGYAIATDITFVVEADTGNVYVVDVSGEAVEVLDHMVVMTDNLVPSIVTPTSAGTPTPSTKTSTGTNAKTGDPSNTLLWVMTALDSVGIFAAGTLIGRKKRKEEDDEE